MLSAAQRAAYDRDGVIVVPDVFSPAEIAELRAVTEGFVERAARVGANDEIYDLEDSHSAAEPRVRRLKAPHLIDPGVFPGQPQRQGRCDPRVSAAQRA